MIEDDGSEEVVPPADDDPLTGSGEAPADETPIDEAPTQEPPVADPSAGESPAEEPLAESPDVDDEPTPIDPDIFDPPTSDPEPETMPAEDPQATEPATDPLEGIGTPSPFDLLDPGSGAAEPPANDGTDDPSEESTLDDSPAGGESEDDDPGSTLDDDLFGTSGPSGSPEAGMALGEDATRVWTDASGRYSCEAQLVEATARGILLLRSSDGAEISVSYQRLSNADLQYLRARIDGAGREDHDGAGDLVATRN